MNTRRRPGQVDYLLRARVLASRAYFAAGDALKRADNLSDTDRAQLQAVRDALETFRSTK